MIEFAEDGEMLTVGKLLKNERERQELSLEDVSERTKINIKYLQAIEEDRKEGFPGELYCELFTKSYAEALGLEYAKIRAGAFTGDSRGAAGKKSRKGETTEKAKEKKPGGPRLLSAETGEDAASEQPEENGKAGNGKKDIIKYFIIIAAIVLSLLMVVIYISISSEKPDTNRDEQEHTTQPSPASRHEAIIDSNESAFAGEEVGSGDSFYVGPVQMYPDSLELTLVATQESWASVSADSNTVFSSFFQPGKEYVFRAAKELDVSLGRWEFVKGKIYMHPMKSISSFHHQGRNSVSLHITKDNWEAFIDSMQLNYDER